MTSCRQNRALQASPVGRALSQRRSAADFPAVDLSDTGESAQYVSWRRRTTADPRWSKTTRRVCCVASRYFGRVLTANQHSGCPTCLEIVQTVQPKPTHFSSPPATFRILIIAPLGCSELLCAPYLVTPLVSIPFGFT